jgi:RNA polymerase sigma-70 factor (ECF subfamily)
LSTQFVTPALATSSLGDWDWHLVRAQCLREAEDVLGHSGTAEDAAQEAAVRAWRRRDSCLTPERPQPWVATIARREALRIAQKRRTDALEQAGEVVAVEDSHEDQVLGQADIDRAIDGLSGFDREVIRGRYWDDLNYGQLGRLLRVPEGTARVRHHRALARLRQVLMEA